jgi:hypothetical protein
MLIFDSSEERKGVAGHLLNMPEENIKYCMYPDKEKWIENDYAKIMEWMDDV